MSTTVRWDKPSDAHAIGNSSQTIASSGTVAFDFGTPDDLNLASSGYKPGDMVMVILSATRAGGTTDTLTFTIQDAPDSSGSIGTPATAVIGGTIPAFAANSGAVNKAAVISVKVQPGRPWLRVNAVDAGGGTDSFQAHCSVWGVRS